jgi:NADH-quinone oxidoreductase subunit M
MNEFLTSIGYDRWILHALIVLPLVGAVPVALAPAARARHIALGVTLLELLLSLGLWWSFDASATAMQFGVAVPWLPEWGITYQLGLDGI